MKTITGKSPAYFTIVLTCLNEADMVIANLQILRQKVRDANLTAKFIVVDDGSSASSRQRLSEGLEGDDDTLTIFFPSNRGRGAAVAAGIRASETELTGFIDPDLEIAPEAIFLCLEKLEKGADIALVSRYFPPENVAWFRKLMTSANHTAARVALGALGFDTEAGCKFFRKSRVLKVLNEVRDERWFWDTEIITRALHAGLVVDSVPFVIQKNSHRTTVKLWKDIPLHIAGIARLRLELWKK